MTRQEYNREIIKQISEYIEANPDTRFFQALWNMNIIESNGMNEETGRHDIIDKYNEESKQTLGNIRVGLTLQAVIEHINNNILDIETLASIIKQYE
jgi:hypothetical protein